MPQRTPRLRHRPLGSAPPLAARTPPSSPRPKAQPRPPRTAQRRHGGARAALGASVRLRAHPLASGHYASAPGQDASASGHTMLPPHSFLGLGLRASSAP
eukprot:7383418-Prymnesium_polylepis.1